MLNLEPQLDRGFVVPFFSPMNAICHHHPPLHNQHKRCRWLERGQIGSFASSSSLRVILEGGQAEIEERVVGKRKKKGKLED